MIQTSSNRIRRLIIIDTGFRGLHPLVQLIYYTCMAILIMLYNHPYFLIICCFVLIIVNIMLDSWVKLLKWMKSILFLGGGIILLNTFLVTKGETVLWIIGGRAIMLEPLLFSFITMLMLMAILLLFVAFNNTLNGQKFLYIFSSFFQRTAIFTMLAMRFVPLLKMRLHEISDVQRVKGLSISHGSIKERAQSGMLFLQVLLTWSLTDAIDTADAMKARGYGTGEISKYKPYRFIWKHEGIIIGTIVSLFGICIVGLLLGYGRLEIYPKYNMPPLTLVDALLLFCITIISAFPLIIEGREALKWHYLK